MKRMIRIIAMSMLLMVMMAVPAFAQEVTDPEKVIKRKPSLRARMLSQPNFIIRRYGDLTITLLIWTVSFTTLTKQSGSSRR